MYESHNQSLACCLQVVGFAHKHLGMSPSMTVVQDPVVVTAVVGLWKGRGLSPWTIKVRVQHIVQAQAFVSSRYCPKEAGWTDCFNTQQAKCWYKNLGAKVLAEAEKHPKKMFNVGLWEAWQHARTEYVAFVLEFKVRTPFFHGRCNYPPTIHCSTHI